MVYFWVKHDGLIFIFTWFRRDSIKSNINPRFLPLGLTLSENCQLSKWWKSVDGLGIRSNQRNFVLYGFSFRNSLAFQYCKSAKHTHWKDTIKYFFKCRKRSACHLNIYGSTDHGLDSPLVYITVTLLISLE